MSTDHAMKARCPIWCRHNHRAEPSDASSDHTTEPAWVPVTLLRREFDGDHRHLEPASAELVVVLVQPIDSGEAWVHVGQAEDAAAQLELSVGSAHRLLRAIGKQLDQL